MLLKLLKRWLGWDSDSKLLDFADLAPGPRPPSVKPTVATNPRPAEPAKAQKADTRAETKRDPLDVLDNPRLTLDKPADDGFDPYNTGAFNRSASWERIGRQRKR
jgi:hypothetical protein